MLTLKGSSVGGDLKKILVGLSVIIFLCLGMKFEPKKRLP
jgi:hypothetical protein